MWLLLLNSVAANIICISILLALMGCMDELGDEGFSTSYAEYCASCHGENLEGTGMRSSTYRARSQTW